VEYLTTTIGRQLGLSRILVLSGANIADDVANDQFCESTLACCNITLAKELAVLFQDENFKIDCSSDMHSVELYGALKNVIALGAGAYTWSENIPFPDYYIYS